MRRRRDPRREMPASRLLQSDLFALPFAGRGPEAAAWRALPEGTRRSLTDLLARLLLEHAAETRRVGGRHDR